MPESVYSDKKVKGLEAGGAADVNANAEAVTNTDALSELLDPLSSIANPSLNPAGTIPTDAEEASLSGLTDANLESGVMEEVYGADKVLKPDALLKVAQAAGPQVLESNRWDASNRLIGNTNAYGDITTYKYDGDGNRVSMRTTIDGAIQDAYLSSNPAGNRDGWEPQYKKRQIDIYFTNDITMSIPQPLMATGADGQNWNSPTSTEPVKSGSA